MKKILTILLCLLTLFGAIIFTVCKNDNDINLLKGNVIYIYDGDTIEIKTDAGKEYKIRLSGIDAPEYDQKYGKESGEYLTLLVNGKDVCIKVYGTDKYNRILGTIFYNEKDINYKMIEAGYAWHYKYYDDTKEYEAAEIEAQNKKIGLWQDNDPIAPWDYRHNKKNTF